MLSEETVAQLVEMGFPRDVALAASNAGCSTADAAIAWWGRAAARAERGREKKGKKTRGDGGCVCVMCVMCVLCVFMCVCVIRMCDRLCVCVCVCVCVRQRLRKEKSGATPES